MKKSKLIPMTEEEEYRNAGITKEEISKLAEKSENKKMFYTSDGVKIIGYSNAKEFNKALEEWTKKNQDLVEKYPKAIEDMKKTEEDFNE